MTAIKNSRFIRHYYPESDATIYYIDIRTPCREHEEYNKEARNTGVNFVRGKVAEVIEDPITKNLVLSGEDTLTGEVFETEADMVVLSTAMMPPAKQDELRGLLKVERATDGFVKEFHLCLAPVDTKKLGVYIAGVAQGPKSIPEAVSSAKGAASSAETPMINKQVEIAMVRSIVDEKRCSGCELCAEICPYQAITMKNRTAVVNEMDCRGCGVCAAICPSSAITLRNFTDEQYEAYLDKLFADQ
jgi:heterodisulfide reductase subunit A